ncbi:hypothetical protein [Zhongshania sp. BJYM1]|uniref:hypothetical protein n=1 Tax=Zhongshania aquatica TaxID=2965069 RepID=UPI0022B32000|nr:hypothetical protein [Marortus sp. BJYM1]
MAKDKGPLLGELEELKAVLRKPRGVDLSAIPLLDDIITEYPEFVDDAETEAEFVADNDDVIVTDDHTESSDELMFEEVAQPQSKSGYADDGNYEREIFMQEVIDSMMPEIESELRIRLLSLDESILERWYAQLQSDK